MNTPLTVGSVCTGYGGLDIAVCAVLGARLAWVADNAPGASKILLHRYPDAPNLGDIKTVDWAEVKPVDIVCGGYPCQPFSNAGLQKGIEDERHLWPNIAAALGVLRPRLAIFENVAAHLGRGFDTVLADLAGLGFDAQWCTVRASQVGAPHRRDRLFFIAWPAERRGEAPADPAHLGHQRSRDTRERWPRPADGHLAPADADLNERARESAQQPRRAVVARSGGDTPTDPGGDRRDPGPNTPRREPLGGDAAERGGAPGIDWGPYAPAVARWEHVLGRPAPRPVDDRGRLAPVFVEWMQGIDAGHVTDVPDLTRTQQLHALGNGVVPAQAIAALHALLPAYDLATAPVMEVIAS